tara:strand:- start:268 stop:1299 length:1032 start_codon:yes stop_codon:yes gene_type:complete
MRILVTGGSGFIGSHTCLVLLERGYELLVIDSEINSSRETLDKFKSIIHISSTELRTNLKFIKGDVRDLYFLNNVFSDSKKESKSIQAVIHFAGLKAVGESIINPILYWDVNVNGTINLLKVMESYECRTIIFSSSATIYSSSSKSPIKEDAKIEPISPYGNTKAVVEKILENLYESNPNKWRISTLRYFNPIGAHPSGLLRENPVGFPNNIFPIITKVALGQLKELNIFGKDWDTNDGTGVRDYIHVMDLAEGHSIVLDYLLKKSPQLINLNLGTGRGTSVLELINTFQRVNNVKVPYSFTSRRKGDVCSAFADNELAKNLLDWIPKRNLDDMCRDGWIDKS